MQTHKEQRLQESAGLRRVVVGMGIAVLGVLVVAWIVGYGIVHYQSGVNTCIGKGYTKTYCQYLLK